MPTGALTSLPLHVLVTKKPDLAVAAADRYREAAWLLNDKAITVLPSVTSIRALRTFAKTSRATKPFIGFGDPQFQRSGGNGKWMSSRSVQPYQTYYNGTTVDIGRLRSGLPALRDTGDKLRAVAQDVGASDSDVKLGTAATVTTVSSMLLDRYRVIDFATHGLVAGEVGGLSEPALVLSIPDRPTAEDDGLLTASHRQAAAGRGLGGAVGMQHRGRGHAGRRGLVGTGAGFLLCRGALVDGIALASRVRRSCEADNGGLQRIEKKSDHRPGGGAPPLDASLDSRSFIPDDADPSVWAPFVLVGEGG